MAALDDWAVALILLAICGLVIVAIALACRLFASWRFNAFFGGFSGEEKAQLTKTEHRNGYMVGANTTVSATFSTSEAKFVVFNDAQCHAVVMHC